jgi:hypothetical protein
VQVPIVRGRGWSQIQVPLSDAESEFIRQALQTSGHSVSASLRALIVEFFTRTRGQTPGLTLNVEPTGPLNTARSGVSINLEREHALQLRELAQAHATTDATVVRAILMQSMRTGAGPGSSGQ